MLHIASPWIYTSRAAPAAALGPIAAGGGGAPHAYANPRKRLLTRPCLLTFIHFKLIHSLMLISFEDVNYLFNMNFLRWKNHLALADGKL